MLEEVAASGACMNGASSVHLSIFGMHPVVVHGTEEMKQRFLPQVADGSMHVAFGVTEPNAGTDTTKISTRAVRDGDDYVINGRKVWTSKALEADRILLLTRTTPLAECKKPTDGMTLFLVDRHAPGVEARAIAKMGRNAVASCETTYDDVHRARRGPRGRRGPRLPVPARRPQRRTHPGGGRGAGHRTRRAAASGRLRQRPRRVRPADRQEPGHRLPAGRGPRQAAGRWRSWCARRRWRIDAGLPCGEEANLAKYLAAEAGFFAADRAVQTHGGFGYATEYHVERYFREARLPRIAPDQPGADPGLRRRARAGPAPLALAAHGAPWGGPRHIQPATSRVR